MTKSEKVKAFLNKRGPDDVQTWGEWFQHALANLITQGEGFSGKRPLGDSGWQIQLADDMEAIGITEDDLIDFLSVQA